MHLKLKAVHVHHIEVIQNHELLHNGTHHTRIKHSTRQEQGQDAGQWQGTGCRDQGRAKAQHIGTGQGRTRVQDIAKVHCTMWHMAPGHKGITQGREPGHRTQRRD